MKAYPTRGIRVLTGFLLIISFFACSPKCVIRGQVVDAETRQPIMGAAVAIRWLEDKQEGPTAETTTFDAIQTLSNSQGVFLMPDHPEKKYILGIYKAGYICWSSRNIFTTGSDENSSTRNRARESYQFKDGMQIELMAFNAEVSKELHAGFTVMVAAESTAGQSGLFHEAIESEFRLWRKSLREDFQNQFVK